MRHKRRLRMLLLTLVTLLSTTGIPVSRAQADLPESISRNLSEITTWLYRGGITERYPSCTGVCADLWVAEHAVEPTAPYAHELSAEIAKLRERVGVLRELGTLLGWRDLPTSSAQTVGWKLGPSYGRQIWIEGKLPVASQHPRPPTGGSGIEPVGYRVNWYTKNARVAGAILPRDGWVISGTFSSTSTWNYQEHCGPWGSGQAYIPPVGHRWVPAYGSVACSDPPWAAGPVFVYELQSPVASPPTDYASQTADVVVANAYYINDPGFTAAKDHLEPELDLNASEYYWLLLPWLMHQLGDDTLDPVDPVTYLERHKPQFSFSSQEDFYPQAASAFTNNAASIDPYDLDAANQLIAGDFVLAAGSSPETGTLPPPLTLGTLGHRYALSGSPTAYPTDYIDAHGSDAETYSDDSYTMRVGGHDQIIYGRWVEDPVDAEYWLQYWTFYYYNSYSFLGIGLHEGDWEMIQVHLNHRAEPDVITYAAHDTRYSCLWSQAETDLDQPIVYVAAGSHASYPHSGSGSTLLAPGAYDDHEGFGLWSQDAPLHIIEDADSWLSWPGRWGSSPEVPENAPSPVSPSQQGDKWSSPSAFHAGGETQEC